MVRRIRILDATPKKDATGATFVSFAIDGRHGYGADDEAEEGSWRENEMTGCAYLERGEVFVKVGENHRAAEVKLGKRTKPAAAHVCEVQDKEQLARR